MTYVTVDVDGTLAVHAETPTSEIIREQVGDWDMVPMPHPANRLHGWVNDLGLIDGKTARNPHAALLMMAFGASRQPYAGKVVITGWDLDSGGSEIASVDDVHLQLLRGMHSNILAALAGDDAALPVDVPPEWPALARAEAEYVLTEPPRGPMVLTGDDALAFLRSMRGVS